MTGARTCSFTKPSIVKPVQTELFATTELFVATELLAAPEGNHTAFAHKFAVAVADTAFLHCRRES